MRIRKFHILTSVAGILLFLFSNPAHVISQQKIASLARGGADGGGKPMAFTIQSAAFHHEGTIPPKHTCDGPDLSPPVSWSDPPAGMRTFALIVDDPDAPSGTWVHWVVYDIPAQTRALAEGVPKQPELKDGTRQGRNDFQKPGYGGPCPPRGGPHRYFFKIYALDTTLNLRSGATKAEVEKAMKGHILAQSELMGRYKR